ncbi:hypothetical protein TorRG33x02_055880 [Trema orientale]|uniref:Transmembrane protein n=1 Tax=Trema orientale TaxID=63057 RepID=A0A2P5FLL6_TREOI|nr:hypothetical protein TorRG33x02_055880 [Trema orientale]
MASRASTLMILFCLIIASFALVHTTTAAHLKGFRYFKINSKDVPKQPPQGAKGFPNFRRNGNDDPRQPPQGAKGIRPKANVSPASPVLSSLAKALQSKSNGSSN